MITFAEAENIHEILIETFGGSKGIRDKNGLESALNRPYATFDQQDLYPSPIDKAAAILESIVLNHPFVDGNKRAGYVFMRLTLMEHDLSIEANENVKYQFVIRVSKGEMNIAQIKEWIGKRTVSL